MASRSTISRDEIADGIPVRHRALAYLTVSSDRIPNPFFLQSATSSAFCFFKAFAVKLARSMLLKFFFFYLSSYTGRKKSSFESVNKKKFNKNYHGAQYVWLF